MKKKSIIFDQCPIKATLDIITNKWSLLIIYELSNRYNVENAVPIRFKDLRDNLEGISQKMLTQTLRSLEENGMIIRNIYPEVPPRVEYALSKLGLSFIPYLESLEEWSQINHQEIQEARQRFNN
ncbi:helix-turn-helix transcriptional regulator [Halosquirtibacter xylanolyticus]|uniref:winged helix-turn-helix transcriptional regulator n=1 Tax=Halosquirtibacter xylanolyticus TaxID=3374599 RepID=UPI00374991B2|nr:helix-turn-helix transcriptional regulator [Prolixibacteraceae bacterium]